MKSVRCFPGKTAWVTLSLSCHRLLIVLFLLLAQLASVSVAHAHASRENYVWVDIEIDHIKGRFEINVKDVKSKLAIEVMSGDEIDLELVKQTAPQVQAYLQQNFSLTYNGSQQAIEFLEPNVINDTGRFIQYHFRVEGVPQNDRMDVSNTIFLTKNMLKEDPLHRSLVLLDYNKSRDLDFGSENTVLVFGPHTQNAELDTVNPQKILVWQDFLTQGLLHIWAGLDHMLFLFVLLLTTVLTRSGGTWQPVLGVKDGLINTLKIITVFTISHSVTLALAVLGLVNVPAAPVEAIIALSIVFIALNNIVPIFKAHTWVLIFVFGLIHGLGFASAMGDLQFRNVKIENILVMFNVGVELGQIAVVCLLFPLLFWVRKKQGYVKLVMPGLSLMAAVMASYWLADRVGWLK